jgi:predicted N-acetyltransferase YhbS
VSADAVLLLTAHVLPDFAGGGLGRMLVQGMAKDLTRRGVKAIEAFGDAKWERQACVVPAEYLLAVGFKTVRPHHRYPRLRLELKNALSWREDVEVALERLLGSMSPEPIFKPV